MKHEIFSILYFFLKGNGEPGKHMCFYANRLSFSIRQGPLRIRIRKVEYAQSVAETDSTGRETQDCEDE